MSESTLLTGMGMLHLQACGSRWLSSRQAVIPGAISISLRAEVSVLSAALGAIFTSSLLRLFVTQDLVPNDGGTSSFIYPWLIGILSLTLISWWSARHTSI